MAISASIVKDLREKTGAGMMDCKKALEETGGDFEKAANLLRQKGIAVAAKRESKATNEGTIGVYSADNLGSLVELGCETDFVAKTDDFQALARNLAEQVAKDDICPSCDITEKAYIANPSTTVGDVLTEVIGKLGEKIVVKRRARLAVETGTIGAYLHNGSKIGVLVALKTESSAGAASDDVKTVARDIAMQIAWGTPAYITRSEVPEAKLEQEREINRQWAIKEGKPEAAIEKIVTGRMEKFYAEAVLLDQPFIRDADITVGDLIKSVAEKAGEKVELSGFERFRVGETGG